MDLDVWRFAVHGKGEASEHRGNTLYNQDEFADLKYLPDNWWYHINNNGEGIAIDFPFKARPVLSWSSTTFIKEDKLSKAARMPVERICLNIVRKAYEAE